VDEAVVKYYRKLLRTGFEHAGSFDNPSIFLESVGEGRVCGRAGDYMHIFINITNDRIDGIRYLCTCDPTANVAVEILCALAKGKRLEEAQAITEDSLLQAFGTASEDLRKKAEGLLELLNKGLAQYQVKMSQNDLR
jgi:NifU-like protein involved in Fe-S cluster formation